MHNVLSSTWIPSGLMHLIIIPMRAESTVKLKVKRAMRWKQSQSQRSAKECETLNRIQRQLFRQISGLYGCLESENGVTPKHKAYQSLDAMKIIVFCFQNVFLRFHYLYNFSHSSLWRIYPWLKWNHLVTRVSRFLSQ